MSSPDQPPESRSTAPASDNPSPTRSRKPSHLPGRAPLPRPSVNFADHAQHRAHSPTSSSGAEAQLSPAAADRVFPIRSVVSVDPTQTPAIRQERPEGYFGTAAQARRSSLSTAPESSTSHAQTPHKRQSTTPMSPSFPRVDETPRAKREGSTSSTVSQLASPTTPYRQPPQLFNDIIAETGSIGSDKTTDAPSEATRGGPTPSIMSTRSNASEMGALVTARFQHVVTDGGHAIITGRDGETIQRCEDEPIHIPGAVQGFGLLIALEEQQEGKLIVRIVSENSKHMIGYTPKQLFALESFTDILSEEQADNLLDHVDFIRDEDADVVTNGPEVFTISIRSPQRKSQKLWCAMHVNNANPDIIICEFELEDDPVNPLVPPNEATPEPPEDTLNSQPTEEEFAESTHNSSKPLRVLRSARKRKGEAAAMEVFNIMSQVQEQLAAAPNLERFLKILVGVVKELTGFHRVMIYQFDASWNGRVVTELVDPRATKDLYKGLNFPASDIPKQARDLYKVNKVRMLYDRDQETARLVCRTVEDLETPLDLTYSYLRAMSPIHLKYLGNMAVRSSMSISINAFDELWGLIACHSYGSKGMRVSFPIRKMCRLVGDSASRNIERLSYASRLHARKLINTVPTQNNPSGYIIASSEDLLKLFDADFGMLSIRDEAKFLGHFEDSQEPLAMLEYLRVRRVTNVMTSQDIAVDFPDLRYAPGFQTVAGLLLVPLSVSGQDFIVFFRKGQLKEVKWAGNPYEKFIKEGTEGYLEPRKSFRTWSETVVGKCREWTEEEIETAAVLCLVYGKFIEVWRQKEAALQNSALTRLLLANSAHEVRTPLNAIINYLEIALEGSLDQETRDNLAKSHSASKSLIYVINDLLDLTKTEEGGDLVKGEIFELKATLFEATDMFKGDAKRKNLTYEVVDSPGLPTQVIGDQRRVRQAISNVTANAIQNTSQGTVKVEMYVASRDENHVEIETSIVDTGIGMNSKKLDALFRELEEVQTETGDPFMEQATTDQKSLPSSSQKEDGRTLGLGLAVVARIIRNMNGQLRLKSEEGKGSRFIIQLPFDLPDTEPKQLSVENGSSVGSVTPHAENQNALESASSDVREVTLVERGSARRNSQDEQHSTVSRKNSTGSMASGKSRNSLQSNRSTKSAFSNISRGSNRSGKSEADRLIEAIQEPHRVEGWHENSTSPSTSRLRVSSAGARPRLQKRHTTTVAESQSSPLQDQRPKSIDGNLLSEGSSELVQRPGELRVTDQGVPVRPVRVPEDFDLSPSGSKRPSVAASFARQHGADSTADIPESSQEPPTADHMRVLVAEDDPVNSRIIKKRLEKLGHDVHLTVNGEECSDTYCEKSGYFDIILMDMQMPIVDGLTSAKMIRSFEKTHPSHVLSTRAALNGRVPIIVVSASLVEKERSVYTNAGVDGWILKPIAFNRLGEIMKGIVDPQSRKENLYKPGLWENGGWFDKAQKDLFAADTAPSNDPPARAPGHAAQSAGVEIAAAADDLDTKEEGTSVQSREQQRLLDEQARRNDPEQGTGGAKAVSLPELSSKEHRDATAGETAITSSEQVGSPAPMSPRESKD